ncbi:MAG: ABC transporter permease [Candidatus Tectomicrobia bacterium]|nr:ABC transporter permease [Candidatus Tectomicrobia bacterium]
MAVQMRREQPSAALADEVVIRGSGRPLKQSTLRYKLLSIFSPITVLILWEIMVRLGLLDYRFFPAPTMVSLSLAELLMSGELTEHILASLGRVIAGFLLGSIPGIVIGMLMGWSRTCRAIFDPIVSATFPMPKIALLPLVLLIFGIGEFSKIILIAIGAFFLVTINSMAGVMNIDPVLVEAAHNFGARGARMFRKVVLPSTLPYIFTGLRLSLGVSLIIIVATEFVAANKGIGFLIWISWQSLVTEKMYAGLIVIAVLGLLFTYGLEKLGRMLMPWGRDITEKTR